jgi:hypothetical protein
LIVNYEWKNGDNGRTVWNRTNVEFRDDGTIKILNRILEFSHIQGPDAVYTKGHLVVKIKQMDRLAGEGQLKRQAQTRETRKAFPR